MSYRCCIQVYLGSSNLQNLRVGFNQEEKYNGLLFVLLAHTLHIGEKKLPFLFLMKIICFLPFLDLAVFCSHCVSGGFIK